MDKLKCCKQSPEAFLGPMEDLWTPYKHLNTIIQRNLCNPTEQSLIELESHFKKYKQSFTSLLLYPQKNEKHRQLLKNGLIDGVPISKYTRSVAISKELLDEAVIISDMFNVDEIMALELLCTAQREMIKHPGLSRGLVAVLLYYDGKKALVQSLRDLFRATNGISWVTEIPKEISNLITSFTQNLVNQYNILERIVGLLDELDISKEIIILTKNRALGSKKHQNQVQQIYNDIRMGLATALFYWSAQRGLSKEIVIKLIKNISNCAQIQSSGIVDDITLKVIFSLMYACDTSVLMKYEAASNIWQNIPIFSQGDFLQTVYDVLMPTQQDGLIGTIKLAFGLALTGFRHASMQVPNSSSKIIAYDEQLIDAAINSKVFEFLYYYVLENKDLYRHEFFYRRIHMLLTDFIEFMHSKVTELRGKADETARTVMGFIKEGLEPPFNLDHSFEMLMLCISKFYKDNRAGLALCVEFWEPLDSTFTSVKATTRSVSLFKFIRLAGELLPSTLFVSYLKMIAGLTSCEKSARNTFNLLKQASGLTGSTTLSWEHFFGSLIQYYSNLRQEHGVGSEISYKTHLNRSINPQEIEALQSVLEVIRAVATYDELSRIAICENPNWAPLQILLGLLSCPVPLMLKGNILQTLAALTKSKETATIFWNILETSQIIPTLPVISSNKSCNLLTEISQNESRLECYPLSQGILDLIFSLLKAYMPKNLGADHRKPGLQPYITFVVEEIFFKFFDRQYKNLTEKWEICLKCLKILNYLVQTYEPAPKDFEDIQDQSSPMGYYIMLQLHKKSHFLNLLLLIIDDARQKLDEYEQFNEREMLEESALLCLLIIEEGLIKQKEFLNSHNIANTSNIIFGLSKIILDVNPRSQRPDHLLNITKFVMYCSWLPNHSFAAVNILNMVSKMPNISNQILDVFISNGYIYDEIRQGFVDCLDMDINATNFNGKSIEFPKSHKIYLKIKTSILEFLRNCISQPYPNIGYYLLGFEYSTDSIEKRKLNIADSTNHCLKAIIALLDEHLEAMKISNTYDADLEQINKSSYFILYLLCSNTRTSEGILRYLRASNDFICRHLHELPFKNIKYSHILYQTSYLLECTAIELKLASSYCQISRVQQICEILLGTATNKADDQISINSTLFFSHSSPVLNEHFIKPKSEKVPNFLLSNILDYLEFEVKEVITFKWDFFDISLSKQIFDECESITEEGHSLINLQKLHRILHDELCNVQGTIAGGQRKLILQEIESILIYALKINEMRNKNRGTIKVMDAWAQVSEIIFIYASENTLPYTIKQELLFEMLQKLLNKAVSIQPPLEISILTSEAIFILIVCLRQCFSRNLENMGNDKTNAAYYGNMKTINIVSSDSNILNLKSILKRLLEWIVVSDVKSQKLRINLYAAILSCLRMLNGHLLEKITSRNYETFVSRLDKNLAPSVNSVVSQVPVELFSLFGDKLIDIMCRDCVIGHDVCKMLAMSCFVSALEFNNIPSVLQLFANRGYLANVIENLEQSDQDLCLIVSDSIKNIKALYVYESHMALLFRFANCSTGAEMLLSAKLLSVLSKMRVFDLHPNFQGFVNSQNTVSEFLPAVDNRFRQIFFPAIQLCNAIITTLGMDNLSAISHIANFLFSHFEIIEFILRTGLSHSDLGIMNELSVVTGIIARVMRKDIYLPDDVKTNQYKIYSHKINRYMLHIFCYFVLNNDILKRNTKMDAQFNDFSEPNCIKHFVDIAANVTIFFRYKFTNTINLSDILFTPKKKTSLKRIDKLERSVNESLDFTTVLNHLQGSVEYLEMQKRITDNIVSRRSYMADASIDNSARLSNIEWTKQYENRQKELSLYVFIIEQTLYLLWLHLDFYVRSTASATGQGLALTIEEYLPNATTIEDFGLLKQNMISVFNETFCNHLSSASGSDSANYFNCTLVRRIKSLIQLLPGV
ncbi:PREDICTED: nuclear pore complex protein Nup205 isoform X2 [Bactrocera latifrons]|uniref:nuclear pore complex protein Nup205 isoform X2 n=1 Tax=Bactrocera latifrons TaxID=174628 RepID=UPI0008DC7B3D|nr:PREDICTED: nuclear pore complex protein Nup205 isoform X2 [Bactrocera latifrons]